MSDLHLGRRVIGSSVAVGLVVLASMALLAARVPLFRVRQDTVDGRVVSFSASQPLRQTLSTHYPGLASVTVLLGEPTPPDDQTISLELYDVESQQTARLGLTGPLADFRVGNLVVFQFEPLDDSAGRRQVLVLSTDGEQPVSLLAHSQDVYSGGELDKGGDLWLELRYEGRLIESLPVLLERLAAGKPGLFGQPWFYAALAIACGLVWLWVILLVGHQALGWLVRPRLPLPNGHARH